MTKQRLWHCLALLGLAAALPPVRAESPPDKNPSLSPTEERAVAELAARIDALIDAGYQAKKVMPAPQADDAEFLRQDARRGKLRAGRDCSAQNRSAQAGIKLLLSRQTVIRAHLRLACIFREHDGVVHPGSVGDVKPWP